MLIVFEIEIFKILLEEIRNERIKNSCKADEFLLTYFSKTIKRLQLRSLNNKTMQFWQFSA